MKKVRTTKVASKPPRNKDGLKVHFVLIEGVVAYFIMVRIRSYGISGRSIGIVVGTRYNSFHSKISTPR